MIGNLENDIYVSSVSLWEISLKFSVGKLQIESLKLDDLNEAIQNMGFSFLDLSASDAITFHNLPKVKNKDPFDRMLVWQCIRNDYYLMSVDKSISEYKKHGLKLA